jgi:DNA (cytosine-5)-methyltransferase 1
LGLDIVLADLESIGYAWETFVIPAIAVGAYHRRDRVFIVAHSDSIGTQRNAKEQIHWITELQMEHNGTFADFTRGWDISKPRVLGVGNGVPNRAHRIKSLGNAVVPQQIYPILAAIKQIDEQWRANG